MFKCLDDVPEATEEEIRESLITCGWDSKHAVIRLKVKQLGKCPDEEWTFGFENKADVCRMVLATSGWDLEVAKARVRNRKSVPIQESRRELGASRQPDIITGRQSMATTSHSPEPGACRPSGPAGILQGAAGEPMEGPAKKTKSKPPAAPPISRK
jgi:hypothetical protein